MKVFWSWQSDLPPSVSKKFVQDALSEALDKVALDLELSPAERPELDHDTKGEAGLVEIVNTILQKIDSATVFVADVTPIAVTAEGKKVPNPNVMIELGHALKSLGHAAIVLVANTEFGGKPEDLPFDLRHRRGAITFRLGVSDDKKTQLAAKKGLVKALVGALNTNLSAALAKNDSATEFARMDAPSADPSTWLNHDEKIEYSDFYGGAGIKAILASGRTRSYFRMAPAGWHHQKPTRSQLQNIPANLRLNPLGRWSSWDGGANQVGWVSVATPPHGKTETTTVTQWFDATAEIWAFDSSIIDDVQGFKMLGIYRVMKDWQTMLRRALAFYNHLEAKSPFRVEVGLGGLNGVHWPDHLSSKRVLALESSISSDEISRDWSEDKIVDFILASATKMYDAFNQPAPSRDAVVHILRTTPE